MQAAESGLEISRIKFRKSRWQEVTQSAHDGYVASFYKKIYVDGSLQDTVWINTSYYSASPRYITVGTKKESSDGNSDQKEEADNTSGDKKNE